MKHLAKLLYLVLAVLIVFAGCKNPASSDNNSGSGSDSTSLGLDANDAAYQYNFNADASTIAGNWVTAWNSYTGAYSSYTGDAAADIAAISHYTEDSLGAAQIDIRWENGIADSNIEFLFTQLSAETDFSGSTITMRVYIPQELVSDGNPGLQIFLKSTSSNWYSAYQNWQSVGSLTPGWNEISVDCSNMSNFSYVDTGFDMTKIVAVGLKISEGGSDSSLTNSAPPIYIDWVKW